VLFDRSLLDTDSIFTTTNTVASQNAGSVNTNENQVIQTARPNPGFDLGDPGNEFPNSASDRALASAGRIGAQGLSSFAVERVSDAFGFGGFVLSASSNSVSLLLRALQQSQRLEVLSRPQIMALDNQLGTAFVGQVVPYIIGSTIDATGARTNTTEFVNVGLGLTVTPRISPDGLVVMVVTAEKSSLGPINEGVPISIAPNGDAVRAPIIDQTLAQTTVSALSGQTVVLSGLLTKRDRALHRRVPILADIPLVGDLFRYDLTLTERTELLIILTPHVVRNRLEAERIKQVESARMSWCLADVIDLHGAVGLKSRDDALGAAEAEVIYPDVVPTDELLPPLPPGAIPVQPEPAVRQYPSANGPAAP
jgi:type II secretory pathway component GspD/PulD (secretin)